MSRTRAFLSIVAIVVMSLLAWRGGETGSVNAQLGTGGISMQVSCGSGDITIANQTDTFGGLSLNGWTLHTLSNPSKKYTLSGQINSGQNVTYRSGPNATGNVLSQTNVFSGSNDGAVLTTTQYGNLQVTCFQGSALLQSTVTPAATSVQGGTGAITMQLYCQKPGEKIVIGNQTNIPGSLNMGDWKFRTTTNGAKEYPLYGQIGQGQQVIFSSGPDAVINVLSSSYVFSSTVTDGGILISPLGTLVVSCANAIGTLELPGNQATATATATITATPTVTATATITPSPTVTSTPAVSPTATTTAVPTSNQWLSGPPPFGSQQCPPARQWLLLYWAGATTPVGTSATACSNADLFWVNRTGKWLGFAKVAPAASDTWESLTGEAHFAHGE